mmetsp:Transcript_47279/g.132031  ORF Transcript_47279/g.132031 Transcript_47279/m.132031 type:complete len:328 (-) Transcript_47279:123-1106(-)
MDMSPDMEDADVNQWPQTTPPRGTPASSGAAATVVQQPQQLGPADGGTTPCYCYICVREALAVRCADLEFRCMQCGNSCVECLDGVEAPTTPSSQPTPSPLHGPVTAAAIARRRRMLRPGGRLGERGVGGDAEGGRLPPRHIGVTCDGCHARDFVGVRYRCLQCRDFDLCTTCHSRRAELHPEHEFEEIRTPQPAVSPLVADVMALAASRAVIAIIEIGPEEAGEAQSGLDDATVAWWLAEDARLVELGSMADEDPPWACPICSEGLEAEHANGMVVRICGGAADGAETPSAPDGHIYHESCLRRWLLTRNSCPVCRRSPVVPEPRT